MLLWDPYTAHTNTCTHIIQALQHGDYSHTYLTNQAHTMHHTPPYSPDTSQPIQQQLCKIPPPHIDLAVQFHSPWATHCVAEHPPLLLMIYEANATTATQTLTTLTLAAAVESKIKYTARQVTNQLDVRTRPHAVVRSLRSTYKHTHRHQDKHIHTYTHIIQTLQHADYSHTYLTDHAHTMHHTAPYSPNTSQPIQQQLRQILPPPIYLAAQFHSPWATHRAPEHPPLLLMIYEANATTATQTSHSHSGCSGGKQDQVYGPPGY
jgi:hypothetical protein